MWYSTLMYSDDVMPCTCLLKKIATDVEVVRTFWDLQ